MLHIAAHARLGKDPVKSGTNMATASVAVDVTQGEGDQQTLWIGVVAFGKVVGTRTIQDQNELLFDDPLPNVS